MTSPSSTRTPIFLQFLRVNGSEQGTRNGEGMGWAAVPIPFHATCFLSLYTSFLLTTMIGEFYYLHDAIRRVAPFLNHLLLHFDTTTRVVPFSTVFRCICVTRNLSLLCCCLLRFRSNQRGRWDAVPIPHNGMFFLSFSLPVYCNDNQDTACFAHQLPRDAIRKDQGG